jgi:hypothetical protein
MGGLQHHDLAPGQRKRAGNRQADNTSANHNTLHLVHSQSPVNGLQAPGNAQQCRFLAPIVPADVPFKPKHTPPCKQETAMTDFVIENIRIEPEIGDGVMFTLDLHGTAHRFFVSRETLSEVERTRLTDNHDMLASFDRQSERVKHAVSNTLRLGTSHNITFLKTDFFH